MSKATPLPPDQCLTNDGQVPGLTLTQSDCLRSVHRQRDLYAYRTQTVRSLEARDYIIMRGGTGKFELTLKGQKALGVR